MGCSNDIIINRTVIDGKSISLYFCPGLDCSPEAHRACIVGLWSAVDLGDDSLQREGAAADTSFRRNLKDDRADSRLRWQR